jgi:hypothetical protein
MPAPQPKGGNEKTGPLPLHPMAMGDLLDGAIKLLRANARTMVVIVATFMVPFELLLAFSERNLNGGRGIVQIFRDPTATSSQNNPSTTIAIAVFAYLIMWLVIPLVCAGASRVVMASYLGGELKAKEALVAAFKHAPAILVATLVVHLAEVVSLLGLIVGVAFVMPLFIMTAPAISLEDLGPWAGIRRSVSLARRRYWPTVGIALLSGLLAYFLNQILGLVPGVIALFVGLRWGWLIVAASGIMSAFVTVSIITIVATLVYIDARIRQEGFDIEVLAANMERR